MRSYWKIKLWAKFVNHFDVSDNLWSRKIAVGGLLYSSQNTVGGGGAGSIYVVCGVGFWLVKFSNLFTSQRYCMLFHSERLF